MAIPLLPFLLSSKNQSMKYFSLFFSRLLHWNNINKCLCQLYES